MKKTPLFYLITLISTLLFVVLQLVDFDIIREQIESKTYDLRLNLRNYFNPQKPLKDIVIVAVDEKSIKEIGRWPWRRDVQAMLVSKISQGKPKVIGIDIQFTEPENKETDGKLAEAIKKAGNVVLAMPFIVPTDDKKLVSNVYDEEISDLLWDSEFTEVRSGLKIKSGIQKGIDWKAYAYKAESVSLPLKELTKVSTLGNVYSRLDMDGVLRWEVMYINYGNACYPSFSLQVSRIALGIEMKDMILFAGANVKLGSRFISTDLSGKTLINYIGRENSFPYKSASDVINDKISSEFFKDNIVLVGTSALATYDIKITPFSANMPGVEKNATVVQNILLNNFLKASPGIIELLVIVFTGIFLGLIIPRLKAIASSILAISFIVLYIFISCYLLIYHGLWLTLIYPVLNMFSISAIQTGVRFFHEEKKAREIREMFSSYVSPKIVEILINDPEKAGIGGIRREVTILFSDIKEFTSFSEKHSPEEVVAILNEYLGEMAGIVFKWDGTLDKFIGDAILAFWGAPIVQKNHAELAVRCALNMIARLNEMQVKRKTEGKPMLDIGIGINTGEVLVGNIGAVGKKMDYTVIGDHVNLASRVESLTRKYNANLLITESTLNKIKDSFDISQLGHVSILCLEKVIVKGKEKPVDIFELKTLEHNAESKII